MDNTDTEVEAALFFATCRDAWNALSAVAQDKTRPTVSVKIKLL